MLLSQLGAEQDSPVRFLRYHAVVEDRVRETGMDYTFLRPNLFFQGLFAFTRQIAATGTLSAPIADAVISAIDVRDIAECSAAALLDGSDHFATYTLTGPRAITHTEIADALSRATGRQIQYVDTDPQSFSVALTGLLPPWQIEGLLEDYAHYRRGEAAQISNAVRELTGHDPRSIDDFARAYKDIFST